MEAKKPTLEDVGRVAGVSRATASRVITGGRRVADDTRDRVWQAVETLGYHPDLAARALAKGRNPARTRIHRSHDVVDLVVIDDDATQFGSNPYYTRVVAGILEALAGSDAQMRVHVVDHPDAPRRLDDVADEVEIGALLVNVPPELAARFHQRCERVISLGHSAAGVPSIEARNEEGARAAIEHLYATGRRKVAAVHGDHSNSCARGRKVGYRSAAAAAGRPVIEVDAGFCLCAGIEGTNRLLDAHPDLDAIFAGCDLTAMGVLQVLGQKGLRVPDDVALVGFDDSMLATVATPALTSVRQPVEHIAATATRALVAGEANSNWHRLVPTPLKIRASTTA